MDYMSQFYLRDLGISKKAYLALNRANIWTVKDLAKLSRKDLLNIRCIGDKAITEIETALIKHNLFHKTRLGGYKEVEYVVIGGNLSNKPKKTFKVYSWIYLESETEQDIERYKNGIIEEYRRRNNISSEDEVLVIWSPYLPYNITGYEEPALPQFADIRLFTMSKDLEMMSTCHGYAIVLGSKLLVPTQIQLEMNCWINSCRKPEFRSPIILHKDRIKEVET